MKYDYHCDDCDTTFEVTIPMKDTTPVHACECGAMAKKVYYATPIHGFNNGPVRKIDVGESWEKRRNREKQY